MTRLWTEATTGKDLFKRVQELPGFGKQKAQIFVALLAKQLGVRPDGWEAAVGAYAEEGYRSVADVVDGLELTDREAIIAERILRMVRDADRAVGTELNRQICAVRAYERAQVADVLSLRCLPFRHARGHCAGAKNDRVARRGANAWGVRVRDHDHALAVGTRCHVCLQPGCAEVCGGVLSGIPRCVVRNDNVWHCTGRACYEQSCNYSNNGCACHEKSS